MYVHNPRKCCELLRCQLWLFLVPCSHWAWCASEPHHSRSVEGFPGKPWDSGGVIPQRVAPDSTSVIQSLTQPVIISWAIDPVLGKMVIRPDGPLSLSVAYTPVEGRQMRNKHTLNQQGSVRWKLSENTKIERPWWLAESERLEWDHLTCCRGKRTLRGWGQIGNELEHFQAENFMQELWDGNKGATWGNRKETSVSEWGSRGEARPAPEGPSEGFGCSQDSVLGKYLGALFLVRCHRGWKGSEICVLT